MKNGKGRDAPFAAHYQLASYFHSKHKDANGKKYISSHQHFLVEKAVWAGDANTAKKVLEERDPMRMKQHTSGANMEIDGAKWETVKVDIMRAAVQAKFRIPELRAALLATGDAYLEERNGNERHDQRTGRAFWGTGSWGAGGNGLNMNGRILMDERQAIREGRRE